MSRDLSADDQRNNNKDDDADDGGTAAAAVKQTFRGRSCDNACSAELGARTKTITSSRDDKARPSYSSQATDGIDDHSPGSESPSQRMNQRNAFDMSTMHAAICMQLFTMVFHDWLF